MITSEFHAALCSSVDDAFETEHIPWFAKLVNQPSYTQARQDVEAAAAIIQAKAKELGLKCELIPDQQGKYADHRAFSAPAVDDQSAALALVGHCDTVYPRELGFLEFQRDSQNAASGGDRVRGPGVLDMKSGLSVILFGLQAVKRVAPDVFNTLKVRFLCNTDEEVGSPSSLPMFERFAPLTTAALVFEGGRDEDRIITSRKGAGAFKFTVKGKAAHAGNDHAAGVNAIHAIALLIPRLEALTDYAIGTTINVGTIRGGSSKNTVPGEVTCVADARVKNAAEEHRIMTALQQLVADPFAGIDDVPQRLKQVQISMIGKISRPPMEPTQRSESLRKTYEQAAAAVGLGIGEAPLQGGGSDASSLAAMGVPSIDGLGPFGKHFHSPAEWSSLDSLRRRTQALALFLLHAAAEDCVNP